MLNPTETLCDIKKSDFFLYRNNDLGSSQEGSTGFALYIR